MIMKRLLMTALVIGAFAAGAAAQRQASGVTMRGKVMDANTIAEPVEYWEIRTSTGESVVITGRRELPMMKSLRQFKNRSVDLTIEPSPDSLVPSDTHPVK
jgi:hypothetical protein